MSDLEERLLDNGYEGIKFFSDPSYETAFKGVIEDRDGVNHAVYNYDDMIQFLIDEEDMCEEDAADFISYNTIRLLDYIDEGEPMILYDLY